MVLQKAKQMALEQAGTHVESYTKTQNLDLTTDEVQTIAGGVLQVEIQEKERSLVGDGLQLFVKIKATVTTDKMEELAQRIKGKNVAEEDKKLQDEEKSFSEFRNTAAGGLHGFALTNAFPYADTDAGTEMQHSREGSAHGNSHNFSIR